MLPRGYIGGCPACSAIADGFDGFATHLANHDVMLWAVSRAPLKKLLAYERRMGWTFPWASSFGGDFNPDFSVYITEQQQREGGTEYNYQREESGYARGLDALWGAYQWLDRAPRGRNETGFWWRRHDEYDTL